MTMSARAVCAAMSRVLVWQIVTVAFARSCRCASTDRERHPDQVAAADDADVGALDRNLRPDEELDDPEGRGRQETPGARAT